MSVTNDREWRGARRKVLRPPTRNHISDKDDSEEPNDGDGSLTKKGPRKCRHAC